MNPVLNSILSTGFIFAIIRVMTPLLFPALGVAVSELAGSINIALEGIMLISAFFGVIVSAFTGSLLLALAAGLTAGIIMGALLAYFHLKMKADIILGAIALNMFASGMTIFLLFLFTGDKGSTSSLKSLVFPDIEIPLIKSVPILGEIFSGHNILTYVALLFVPLFYVLMFKTPLGLRIRAVGQNPHAAESVGINVDKIKLYALMLSGMFGAFGGLYLAMGYVSWFSREMTAGRGFIAIAAATLGGNMPLGVLLSSLLFGFVGSIEIYISALNIPSVLIKMIPYLVTLIVLAVFAIRSQRVKIKAGEIHEHFDTGNAAEAPPIDTTGGGS